MSDYEATVGVTQILRAWDNFPDDYASLELAAQVAYYLI